MLLVVVRHGRRLLVVRGETLTKCFFIVVGALNKRLARDVVLHGHGSWKASQEDHGPGRTGQ